ncbi:MAG: hydroxymethylglutaryl-CoA lyase [Flavobacteriales bacterium]|jgi:hydroxymethylglutaryl-CoA lyase|nr:hydroxymethylglutaryl-CoA lyase [Flavobacteriales bacterium]|tara:strand:- start:828 stop:1664 length:837 start_codon:yes stop_codon:yes gene_type:complete
MKIIECPRDAMQGISDFIPTEKKVAYLNALLKVGFDTLDFGSFVSPKAIPQMKDTADVLSQLNDSKTKLLAIVANQRGADDACAFERIDYLGYPFSVSETFQQRNTNKSIGQSLSLVEDLQSSCQKHGKQLVVYLSMAFGNPYGEHWHEDIVAKWGEKLSELDVKTLALSDTIGVSNPSNIERLFSLLISEYPKVEWGAHLHTHPESWREKVETAYNSGCRRFDGAIKGFGGCPMAKDDLVGNMPTEKLVSFTQEKKIETGVNTLAFESAYNKAIDTF